MGRTTQSLLVAVWFVHRTESSDMATPLDGTGNSYIAIVTTGKVSGKRKGHGSCIMDSSRAHHVAMSTHNMALLSMILTVAHMEPLAKSLCEPAGPSASAAYRKRKPYISKGTCTV